MTDTLPRRGFLRGLVSLPLIGGGVTLIGKPSAAAVPVTDALLHSYKAWLHYEHRMLSCELGRLHGQDWRLVEQTIPLDNHGADYHFRWPNTGRRMAGWDTAPQPSARAAVVLSAVGCDWRDGR